MNEMLQSQQNIVKREIEIGTGAEISLTIDNSSAQTGLKVWFSDLPRSSGPIVSIEPRGLKRFSIRLTFGNFAGGLINTIQKAEDEKYQLARALVRSICQDENDTISIQPDMNLSSWVVTEAGFVIKIDRKHIENRFGQEALADTCGNIVVPLLGAMAELIGYEYVDEYVEKGELEGAVLYSLIKRRERNPRNRLLCLRIHGEKCLGCNLDPKTRYGENAFSLEVHHIAPLSEQAEPRHYDPEKDLIPLCPNCHRYVHTKKPTPWSLPELKHTLSTHDEQTS